MTRPFNTLVRCPHCNRDHTMEHPFFRWFRGERLLDSVAHWVVRSDLDCVIHRYKTPEPDGRPTREIQCMMFIEIKTHCADVPKTQHDTLSAFSQMLRNQCSNMYGRPKKKKQSGPAIRKVFSTLRGRKVTMRSYGGYVLEFSGTCPDDSSEMKWDGRLISKSQLIALLRFDLDPDTLRAPDCRRRTGKPPPTLFLVRD
jgi:hypothetical protein